MKRILPATELMSSYTSSYSGCRFAESGAMQVPKAQNKIVHLDGLRGMAIILVFLFHCLRSVPNGYLGVDVFLVITGFLLFRSFWSDYSAFDVKNFVSKKFVRLWPMGLVIVLFTCAFSLIIFPCNLIERTAETALASLSGVANLYLDYTATDYFGSDSSTNPLLHTWYLSVTVQAYLITCILFVIGRKRSRTFKMLLLSGVALCSAGLYYSPVWLPYVAPLQVVPYTYYMTSARLWMVIVGAFIPILPECGKQGRYVALIALLVIMLMGVNGHHWSADTSGLMDFLTVVCACLCIAYGEQLPRWGILRSRPMVWLGRYSFALYMVHWPVIVFSMYAGIPRKLYGFPVMLCCVIGISAMLSWVLRKYVESRRVCVMSVLGGLVFSVAAVSCLIMTDGMSRYIRPEINAVCAVNYADTGNVAPVKCGRALEQMPRFKPHIRHGGYGKRGFLFDNVPLLYHVGDRRQEPSFILIGDSHAEALYPGMDVFCGKNHLSGLYLHSYVIPLENRFSQHLPYQRWDKEKADMLISYLHSLPEIKTVFVANFWMCRIGIKYKDWMGKEITGMSPDMQFFTGLKEFIIRIRNCGKQVVVFADVPTLPESNPQEYVRRSLMSGRSVDESLLTPQLGRYIESNGRVNEFLADMESEGLCKVLHPESYFLYPRRFVAYQNGVLYYKDQNHLSYPASVEVVTFLGDSLKQLLSRSSDQEGE